MSIDDIGGDLGDNVVMSIDDANEDPTNVAFWSWFISIEGLGEGSFVDDDVQDEEKRFKSTSLRWTGMSEFVTSGLLVLLQISNTAASTLFDALTLALWCAPVNSTNGVWGVVDLKKNWNQLVLDKFIEQHIKKLIVSVSGKKYFVMRNSIKVNTVWIFLSFDTNSVKINNNSKTMDLYVW